MEEILNIQEGLELVSGDKELYKILLDTYLEENKFDPEALKKLLQKKEFEAAAKIIHKTKGASYQIGAKKIGDKAQFLEDLFRGKTSPSAAEKSLEELESLVNDFAADYKKCLLEVEKARLL